MGVSTRPGPGSPDCAAFSGWAGRAGCAACGPPAWAARAASVRPACEASAPDASALAGCAASAGVVWAPFDWGSGVASAREACGAAACAVSDWGTCAASPCVASILCASTAPDWVASTALAWSTSTAHDAGTSPIADSASAPSTASDHVPYFIGISSQPHLTVRANEPRAAGVFTNGNTSCDKCRRIRAQMEPREKIPSLSARERAGVQEGHPWATNQPRPRGTPRPRDPQPRPRR